MANGQPSFVNASILGVAAISLNFPTAQPTFSLGPGTTSLVDDLLSLFTWAGEWRWQSCRSLQSCSSSCPAWADWVRRGRRCELMNQGRLCAPTMSLTVRQSRVGATTKVGGTGREEGWPASQGFRSSNPPLCPGKSRRVSPAESICETLR